MDSVRPPSSGTRPLSCGLPRRQLSIPICSLERVVSCYRGMCQFLRAFNTLQENVRISVHLDSVPGFLNDTADVFSRGVAPSSLGFQVSEIFTVPWTSFPESNLLMALSPVGSSSLLNCLWIFGHQKFPPRSDAGPA